MKELIKKYGEIIRYLIIGGLTTVVSLGTYYLLVWFLLDPDDPVQLQAANIISWIAAVTFAYFTNRSFVFRSKNPNRLSEAAGFFLSRLGTLGLDMGMMFLGVTVCHFNDKIMKLVVQVVVTIGNYVLSKLLVFRKKDMPENKKAEEAAEESDRESEQSKE